MNRKLGINLKKWRNLIDWKLLLLLLLFLNVKLAVKIPAIAIIYLLQPNFRFDFKFRNSRLPLFYLLIIGVGFLSLLLNKSYQNQHYLYVFSFGIVFWILSILAIHQTKLSIEKRPIDTAHRTLVCFFIINAAFSIFNLAAIIWEIGSINPYLYQGQYQKYFISTGDYIKGVTFDTSTTNAIINAIGIFYFLTKKNYPLLILCMVVFLFTGSNFSNISLLIILFFVFILKSTKEQKSIIIICAALLVVFMVKISPQNNRYVNETFKKSFGKKQELTIQPKKSPISIKLRADLTLTLAERKEKIALLYLDSLTGLKQNIAVKKPVITANIPIIETPQGQLLLPQANIHSKTYQSIKVPLKAQHPMLVFIDQHHGSLPYSAKTKAIAKLPGKAIGLLQSFNFLVAHPSKLIAGNGIGNFSSKLAYKATGLGIAGSFPNRFEYINNDFLFNHLDLYLYFFSKQTGYHSLTNSPFSVYDQLLTEYGLLGILAFFLFYVGYFLKFYKKLTYGIPILFFILTLFFVDYWFEQLSILVLFELMIFLDIKEAEEKNMRGPTNG